MSPTSGHGGKSKKRARSVEGLLETTAVAASSPPSQAQAQMKKARSLEEYLDRCDGDAEEDGNSASASATDSLKKRTNFVDKCIVKMKSLMAGHRPKDGGGGDSSK
jgi:hypothetical protein